MTDTTPETPVEEKKENKLKATWNKFKDSVTKNIDGLAFWKKKMTEEEKMQRNIDKVRKKLDRIQKEYDEAMSKAEAEPDENIRAQKIAAAKEKLVNKVTQISKKYPVEASIVTNELKAEETKAQADATIDDKEVKAEEVEEEVDEEVNEEVDEFVEVKEGEFEADAPEKIIEGAEEETEEKPADGAEEELEEEAEEEAGEEAEVDEFEEVPEEEAKAEEEKAKAEALRKQQGEPVAGDAKADETQNRFEQRVEVNDAKARVAMSPEERKMKTLENWMTDKGVNLPVDIAQKMVDKYGLDIAYRLVQRCMLEPDKLMPEMDDKFKDIENKSNKSIEYFLNLDINDAANRSKVAKATGLEFANEPKEIAQNSAETDAMIRVAQAKGLIKES